MRTQDVLTKPLKKLSHPRILVCETESHPSDKEEATRSQLKVGRSMETCLSPLEFPDFLARNSHLGVLKMAKSRPYSR